MEAFDMHCIALRSFLTATENACVALQYGLLRCVAITEFLTQCLINYVRACIALPIARNRALDTVWNQCWTVRTYRHFIPRKTPRHHATVSKMVPTFHVIICVVFMSSAVTKQSWCKRQQDGRVNPILYYRMLHDKWIVTCQNFVIWKKVP